MTVKNKVAYITGGTKGIGWGIAQVLLEAGMKVAISARHTNQATIPTEWKNSDNLLVLNANVSDLDQQQRAVEEVKKKFAGIDLVVANAGIAIFDPIDQLDPSDWKAMIDTNLTGVFYTLKTTVEELKKSEGFFVSIASLAGINFFEQGAGYNASKFGVVGFTQAAMLDLRKYNVRVSTILPGTVNTFFNQNNPQTIGQEWKIAPQDIGELILNLFKMHPRVLPSKVEIRPTIIPVK